MNVTGGKYSNHWALNKKQSVNVYREIIAVCSQIHTKHINTLCGQNVELVNVKPGGTCIDHRALEV